VTAAAAHRRVDLVCFDVDGTLVKHPENKVIWQVLNQRFLGDDSVNIQRFQAYRSGEITYAQWVDLDVGEWQKLGVTRDQVVDAIGELRLVEGARETLDVLQERGYKLAVISGTLDIGLDTLFPDHPFDDVFCNRIEFGDDGFISGWQATPYDMEGKARALRMIADREELPLERCAFVGDHHNDLDAARAAGLAIAFDPKSPELIEAADAVVRSHDLQDILPFL
jgi:HAD superfamily phosphoserine phosphatase-like hydrolase